MQELTKRQNEVLEGIKAHSPARHGMPPSRSELAHGLGLAEASSVTGHLTRLADAGWIELLPRTNRGTPPDREDRRTAARRPGRGRRGNADRLRSTHPRPRAGRRSPSFSTRDRISC